MKYTKLAALLALTQIDLHSNFFGNKKPVAKLDEDQLQSIEDALEQNDTSGLTDQISALETEQDAVQDAVSAAFAENGLALTEGQTVAEAIASLSAKCKEYGEAKNTHSFIPTDGKDKTEDAEPVYEFENVFNDTSKYPTLK